MKRRMDLKELLVRVAELYYMEGLTQEAIAQMLDLSRPQVSRYLKRARELGIVEIRIMSPLLAVSDQRDRLSHMFSLPFVTVVSTVGEDPDWVQDRFGLAVAETPGANGEGGCGGRLWTRPRHLSRRTRVDAQRGVQRHHVGAGGAGRAPRRDVSAQPIGGRGRRPLACPVDPDSGTGPPGERGGTRTETRGLPAQRLAAGVRRDQAAVTAAIAPRGGGRGGRLSPENQTAETTQVRASAVGPPARADSPRAWRTPRPGGFREPRRRRWRTTHVETDGEGGPA